MLKISETRNVSGQVMIGEVKTQSRLLILMHLLVKMEM